MQTVLEQMLSKYKTDNIDGIYSYNHPYTKANSYKLASIFFLLNSICYF